MVLRMAAIQVCAGGDMNRKGIVAIVSALVAGFAFAALLFADDHGRERHGGEGAQSASQQNNQGYEDLCGGCHFAYQPWLLPARSWDLLFEGLEDHYGNAVTASDDELRAALDFLVKNAADRSGRKRAGKIMKSLGGQAPLRVSEVPYIQHKHHELGADVLARPSVGGLGNCAACHRGAAQGHYDDDDVAIPR